MLRIRVVKENDSQTYVAQLADDSQKEVGMGLSVEEAVGNFICLNQDDLGIQVRTD